MKSESSSSTKHFHIHKAFLFCNYILLGAAASCIFFTLSLRLIPSICGLLLLLLHAFTIAGAAFGCAAASSAGPSRWYSSHLIATVLAAIFQGSVSVLIFTRTEDFLAELKSYVNEDNASVILKITGGLAALIFFLEWVVLTLAFFLKYYSYLEGGAGGANSVVAMRSGKVQEDSKNWACPFQV